MPINRKQQYLQKIHALESEMIKMDLDEVRGIRKGRRMLFFGLLGVLTVSVCILFALVQTEKIVLIEPAEPPFQASIRSAHTDNHESIRIFMNVIMDDSIQKRITFHKVKSTVTFAPSKAKFEEEVIPIYLKNREIHLMVQVKGIKLPPGPCDIRVKIVNEKGKSEILSVNHLDPMK